MYRIFSNKQRKSRGKLGVVQAVPAPLSSWRDSKGFAQRHAAGKKVPKRGQPSTKKADCNHGVRDFQPRPRGRGGVFGKRDSVEHLPSLCCGAVGVGQSCPHGEMGGEADGTRAGS